MKIVVVGAGQVGSAVAKDLSISHEIVVVDFDASRLETLRGQADVMTIEGNGADLDILVAAGVEQADILIASTDDDRINILVCATAHAIHQELFTIARVTHTGYLKSWEHSQRAFSVDLMLGSDLLVAKSVVQVIFEQMAQQVAYFADGRVEMAEFRIPSSCDLAGQAVRNVDIYEGLRYAAVFVDDEMEVVRGDTIIPADGRILVIGCTDDVHRFGERIGGKEDSSADRVFLLGGGEISFQIARLLQARKSSTKIIVQDADRADELAELLPHSLVLQADPLDPEFLRSEGIHRAAVAIAATPHDEKNLLAAQQARYLGARRVLSVVHEQRYQSLFEHVGIDATFNPRNKVVEEIIRHTRSGPLAKVTFVEHHRGEVVEVKVPENSPLAARSVADAMKALPVEVVIGAILRSGRVIIPTGETTLEVGDTLVIFASTEVVNEVLEVL